MSIEIEKKKPIIKAKKGRKNKYPFSDMSINDSFFVEGGKYASLYSCAKNYANGGGKQFTIVTEDKGVRVWRVK